MLIWQGLIFALWAVLAFRILFRLRADAVRQSGRMFPGLGASIAAMLGWLRAPSHPGEQRLFALVTLALLASSLAFALLAK